MPTLVTFDFPPARGGIQIYALRLAQELRALGRPVVVIAPDAVGARAFDRTADVAVTRFGGGRGPVRVIAAMIALLRVNARERDGETIALSWLPGLAAAALPRRIRGALTLLVHGTELDVRPGSLRDRAMRFVFANASCIVANSAYVARRVRQLGLAVAPVVVWPGVDARAIERRPAAMPTVVFVGRLVARKGVDRLIDAVALLDRTDVIVRIVGDGPERATLERLAQTRGLGDRIHFSGALDDEARDRALGEAWCFAMPSRAEGDDVEGFGIAYLDAAIAGLPSIGGRDGGAPDAIADGETGLLVDGRDAQAIARALSLLLDDHDRAAAMGEAGRRRALASFSWRATATALVAHLDRAGA